MLSSILAFNSKRGYQAFGRERMESDAEYVTSLMRPSAEGLLRRWRARGEGAHLVRYEDLVSDPLGTMMELVGYLGLDAGEETVRDTIGRASGEDHASSMDQHRTVSDPARSIGRWRNDLPAELADVCNEALGPILAEFGYEEATERVADSA
jgi:Sulfotransferase domain